MFNLVVNELVTDDMLKQIIDLDKSNFKDEYQWTYEYQKELFEKNKKSMIIILYNNKVIGYVNYLTITEEKFKSTLESNIIIDDYNIKDVVSFSKEHLNYVTFNSIVIDEKFRDGDAIVLLTNRLKEELYKIEQSGYDIKYFVATAISNDGRKFCERFGMKLYKKLKDNNYLYIMEIE